MGGGNERAARAANVWQLASVVGGHHRRDLRQRCGAMEDACAAVHVLPP
jgi:hypothetical protein